MKSNKIKFVVKEARKSFRGSNILRNYTKATERYDKLVQDGVAHKRGYNLLQNNNFVGANDFNSSVAFSADNNQTVPCSSLNNRLNN